MYAIIVDGGRQYKVQRGQRVDIDYRDLRPGETITFDRVLAIGSPSEGGPPAAATSEAGEASSAEATDAAASDARLGSPTVEGATVTAEVLGTRQGKKIDVVKLRRRKNSRRHTGHRKMFTEVEITAISR